MNKQQWQRRINTLERELAELKANPPKREPGERWKPEEGEMYWTIDRRGEPTWFIWESNDWEASKFNNFNVFQTREEAEFAKERTKVMRELDLWAVYSSTPNELTYGIYCDQDGEVLVTSWFDIYTSHVFESRKVAEQAIKAIGEERLKKYYFRVVEE